MDIITTPSTGAAWPNVWQQVEYGRKGKMGLSLTNWDATTLPAIASGSWAEVAGSIFIASSEQAISGTPSSGNINYIKLVPSGTGEDQIVTPTWTTDAPSWSDSYQGYYDGTSRYVGGITYDSTGPYYSAKFVLDKGRDTLYTYKLEIGEWDMDANDEKNVLHYLGYLGNIRGSDIIVRRDSDATPEWRWPLYAFITDTVEAGVQVITTDYVELERRNGGTFDSTNFDETGGYNRGWVILLMEAVE